MNPSHEWMMPGGGGLVGANEMTMNQQQQESSKLLIEINTTKIFILFLLR
jgi:hypothetical protein